MANYATLKAAINAVIKANGNKEITGTVLNETLTAMVNSIGANYQFAGVATPSTNPGTPDQNVFYLAGQAGTYTNFNSIVLPNGVSVLKWNGSWSGETVLAGDGVFDISAYKATGGTLATFADLSAALDGGNNIPSSLRKGGMSVKFVQSSDNKYVQYFCNSQTFTTDVNAWEKVNLEEEVSQLDQDVTVLEGDKKISVDFAICDGLENYVFIMHNGRLYGKNLDSDNFAVGKPYTPKNFSIEDGNGNSILVVKNGEVITKNFKSSDIKVQAIGDNDFEVVDAQGKSVCVVYKGQLFTKGFNSKIITDNSNSYNRWRGKNICIIGDSLTELGWFPDEIAKELGSNVYNRGWSGACVTPMIAFGGGLKSYAFTHRFDVADNNAFGNGDLDVKHAGTPSTSLLDLMIIFGGTNDWGHGYIGDDSQSYNPIALGAFTDAMSDTINNPNSETSGASFYAALKYTCYRAKLKYPNVPLVLCTLLPSMGYEATDIFTNRSSEYIVHADMSVTLQQKQFLDGYKSKEDFNNAIRQVAKQFGAYCIDLDKMIGMPDFSQAMAELYYNNGDMTHPSRNFGARVLGKFIAKYIANNVIFWDKSNTN